MNSQTTEVTYKFAAYDPQLPITVDKTERVVKCLYKETKDKVTGKIKKAGINSYIKVPTAHLNTEVVQKELVTLLPILIQYLQTEEDKIIKEAHRTGSIGFGASYFSLNKVIEFIETETQGARLNSEQIHTWFEEDVEELLMVAFAEKSGVSIANPTEAELAKLQLISEAYKAKFGSLASGKTHYRKEDVELLQKVLDITGATKGVIGAKLYSRLEGMKAAAPNDLLEPL